ncbi:actin-like ATPase domain-containing protein [Bimuria novae-zelandiae CBS 107.79]|uniref:Actin-like ATPase domain-containing protein n=1 Tax=Bimuria novae-zelandiae CBS 107.79 TaxID=1447943 RepID=A0A6A5VJK1_9PLEO|nr:actin-like ATPase domain-containing protein [Bimuria novae-zelandiae CBS 107.79]
MSASGERKVSASLGRSVRGTTPRLADLASTPETPRTPTLGRSVSSLFGSPGGSFRTEDEYVVIEVGSRYLRGGFPGESTPRCTLPYDPENQRRVGDYRQWDPDYAQKRRRPKKGQEWGQEYELYRMDLTKVDLRVVEDKFERMMREVYNKYFVLDTKPRRILLALPPKMPHPLMSTLLDVLFGSFQAPSITLMSSPILSTVAAGLRSALVVDIGWAETLVTAVYEFREVHEQRTVRAGRLLSEEMAKVLNAAQVEQLGYVEDDDTSFEEAEEVLSRVAWCKPKPRSNRRTLYFPARTSPILEEFEDAVETPEPTVTIPFPKASPPAEVTIPFATLAKPAEAALFATETALSEFDDHELPLHHLIYRALLSLPVDVRRVCMSRIVITGGVSAMPGLKSRILAELEALVQTKGWDPVRNYGTASARHEQILRQKMEALELRKQEGEDKVPESLDPDNPLPAAHRPQDVWHHEAGVEREKTRAGPPPESLVGGVVRGVETLGPWAGASLVAQQRIRGIVEIDRERYLQHGLQGASKDKEVSVVPQRQSMGPGVRGGAGDRASWTLGVWA